MKNTKFILSLCTLFLFACGNKKEGVGVQTEKIKKRDIVERVEGLGKIKPEVEVKISSDVAGRIVEINGLPGDPVKKGDVLVRIEEKNYINSLKSAQSNLESAEANLKKTKAELKRAKDLFSKGVISQAELEVAQANYDVQHANRKQTKSNVDDAKERLSKCTIRSPIRGIITRKNKELGEIAQGANFNLDVIMTVANLSAMETTVDITENDIVKVKEGQKVDLKIDAFSNTVFQGIVKEIANAANENTGTEQITNFEVKISILNPNPKFRPGMNATAEIKTSSKKDVLSVPIQAVTARTYLRPELVSSSQEQENKKQSSEEKKDFSDKMKDRKEEKKLEEVVFVVVDGKAIRKSLKKGISDDNYYEVIEGLDEGEEVIIGPFKILSSRLKDGKAVYVDNKSTRKQKNNNR